MNQYTPKGPSLNVACPPTRQTLTHFITTLQAEIQLLVERFDVLSSMLSPLKSHVPCVSQLASKEPVGSNLSASVQLILQRAMELRERIDSDIQSLDI